MDGKILLLKAICLILASKHIAASSLQNQPMKNQSTNQAQQQPHQQQQQQPHSMSAQQQSQTMAVHKQQQAQYVHEKAPLLQDIQSNSADDDFNFNDPYQILNDYPKLESSLPLTQYQWNPFQSMPSTYNNAESPPLAQQQLPTSSPSSSTLMYPSFEHYSTASSLSSMHTPKFLPLIGFPQPVFIPFPLYIAPEMFYPSFSPPSNDLEDMARAANAVRRGSTPRRSSPIYYVRLPPTPYLFLAAAQAAASSQSSTPSPYAHSFGPLMSLPSFSSFSSIFNLPVNFQANGKPSHIYEMSSPNDIQNPLQFSNGFNSFGAPRPNPYRPSVMGNYVPAGHMGAFGLGTYQPQQQQQQQQPQQDTKVTSLKRPFFFNGHPGDIYVLPNNLNSIYADTRYN